MARFIPLVEQGDSSVHYVNVEHVLQFVHVPNSPVAVVTTSDGQSFRISEEEFRRFVALISPKQETARGA